MVLLFVYSLVYFRELPGASRELLQLSPAGWKEKADMENKKRRIWKILGLAVLVLAALLVTGFSAYMIWEQAPAPPVLAASPVKGREQKNPGKESSPVWPEGRQAGVYTLLLVGNDDGNGNTDTLIVGRVDSYNHKMDFVSIPRDTLINWDWDIRKINAVYWSYRLQGETGIDQLKEHIKKLTGFEPDCYAVLDIGVFKETVDALGGVEFDVPMNLNYDDSSQNLHIHIASGLQRLNGEQAMGVCRYRSGYFNGDLGRIDMQQQFLKACADQFISLGSIPNLPKVIELLSQGLDTDLTGANIAFFLRQALLCPSENIRFYTLPNTDDTVRGLSYTVVDLEQWIPLLNEALNPFEEPIEAEDLDLVYLENGRYTGTAELLGAWYFARQPEAVPSRPQTAEPEPEASPSPTPFQLPEFSFPPLPGESDSAPPEPEELLPVAGGKKILAPSRR